MFRIVSKHLFWWPVTVKVPHPDDAGRFVDATFEMRFEAMPIERAREIDEARNKLPQDQQAAHAFDFLFEVARDWRDVQDGDGQTIAFSVEAFKAQLGYAWFRDGVLRAYEQAVTGQAARLGNSDAPRVH